jgi:hypothetical protein
MTENSTKILLNEILKLDNIKNVKIRFNLMFEDNWNPIEDFKDGKFKKILEGHYHNFPKKKSYKEGQVTIGFIRIESDKWLLFHIGKVTKDLNKLNAVGYEYETLKQYEKYFGRLIIQFKNSVQQMVRLAEAVINDCEVYQILPDIFDNDIFPGYDNINVSWSVLSRVINKEGWKTALTNQKGVYLITDTNNGKRYVGSAYNNGEMIYGRWTDYLKNGHGDNEQLKKLDFEYIKKYFHYSILDIYKSTIDDKTIINREYWWMNTLLSRGEFGYNHL